MAPNFRAPPYRNSKKIKLPKNAREYQAMTIQIIINHKLLEYQPLLLTIDPPTLGVWLVNFLKKHLFEYQSAPYYVIELDI